MTEEQKAQWHKERAAMLSQKRQEVQEHKEKLKQAMENGLRVVIDLDFADIMKDTEQRSLSQQLMYSYSANSKSSKPIHLIFTSLIGIMDDLMRSKISGFDNWCVTWTPQPYIEHFGEDAKESLIYLTADSPHELHEIDQDKIYIIGGLVDRNRHKNICYKKAESQGIATAKLPLGDFLNSSQVMCTNHVVEMLVKVNEGSGWKEAFESVVPPRKKNRNKESENADDNDEGNDVE